MGALWGWGRCRPASSGVSRVTMVSFVWRRNLWLSVTGPLCGSAAAAAHGGGGQAR